MALASRENAARLGNHLGKRSADHVEKWHEARARAPRCNALNAQNAPCGNAALKFGNRCHVHLHGDERDKVDALRVPWLAAKLRAPSKHNRYRQAQKALAAIERRKLHRAWLKNPNILGSTLILTPGDEERVSQVLQERFNVDLYDQTHSARCQDRLKWAAFRMLAGADPVKASYRVKAALRDDERWRRRHIAETDRALP